MKFATVKLQNEFDPLKEAYWPPVGEFRTFKPEFKEFLLMSESEQVNYMTSLRSDEISHGVFIQNSLSCIYAYYLGYKDSPLHLNTDDVMEAKLSIAKIQLEREMLDAWLKPEQPPLDLKQEELGPYLKEYIEKNTGIYHEFFDYVRDDMSQEEINDFLLFETVRNEVVDDEVALIVVGLQGLLKNTMVANLSDECGNGDETGFHTYWLRRLLNKVGQLDNFSTYRDTQVPWFPAITSNSFFMMATRPGYKYRAYGSFLITESWVCPHFERIIGGLDRLGVMDEDLRVYFEKHLKLDPHHTADMLQGLTHQQPNLSQVEINEILWGAHTAVAAGTKLYGLSLKHFKEYKEKNKQKECAST